MAVNTQNQKIGTGFTNLQNIMAANQGNKLGEAVGSGIQQTGQQVQQGIQQGQQDFSTQAAAGRLDTQQNKENVENVLKDPSQATDADISNFAKYRSGQYSGPKDISNADSLRGQAQQAQQLGEQVGSEGGRQALLSRYAAGPGTYNAGQQRLDTLILGAGNAKPLQEARRSVSGLTQKVAGAEGAAQNQAQQYTKLAQAFGQQVNQRTGQAASDILTPAQQQAEAANIADQKLQAQQELQVKNAQNEQLTEDAFKALGLNPGDRNYGVNVGQYIGYQAPNEQANALNVMAQPQFQQYSKLQQLMGQSAPTQPQNPYQAAKINYDQAGVQAAINTNKELATPYEQAYANAKAALASVSNPQYGDNYAAINTRTGVPYAVERDRALAALNQIYSQYGIDQNALNQI